MEFLKKNFERTQLAVTPWRAQLRTFIFRACLHGGGGGGLPHLAGVPLGKLGPGPYKCSISGTRSLANSNDLNVTDVICLQLLN